MCERKPCADTSVVNKAGKTFDGDITSEEVKTFLAETLSEGKRAKASFTKPSDFFVKGEEETETLPDSQASKTLKKELIPKEQHELSP